MITKIYVLNVYVRIFYENNVTLLLLLLLLLLFYICTVHLDMQWRTEGGSNPPRNSEDIGGVLHRMSKKNWHLDFLL